jgi:hypothetical protein
MSKQEIRLCVELLVCPWHKVGILMHKCNELSSLFFKLNEHACLEGQAYSTLKFEYETTKKPKDSYPGIIL